MTLTPLRAALAALSLLCTSAAFAAGPAVSFTTAKAKAAREGKVLLVDFTATWCMPCRWMDETTFADAQVLSYLRENYVSIKIDIDDFDGFALKQQYEVRSLPTMIFFASDGRQVHRIDEGVGAAEMLSQLRAHDRPEYRSADSSIPAPSNDWTEPFARMQNVYAEESSTAPAEYYAQSPQLQNASGQSVPEGVVIGATASAKTGLASASTERMPMSVPAIETRCLNGVLAKAEPAELRIVTITRDTAGENALTAVPTMTAAEVRIFSLQAGAFSNQTNAVRAADHLRDYTESPVLIEFDMVNDKPVYRIYVGRFTDMSDAEEVSKRLHLHGFSCIPKELAMQ